MPNKSQRREIRRKIEALATLDPQVISPDNFQEKIDEIEALFELYGVRDDSTFHKDFDDAIEVVTLGSPQERNDEKFTKEKRSYMGMSGNVKLRVKAVYDHAFISRKYGRSINITWRFNKRGRIDLVDRLLMPENEAGRLIVTDDYKTIEPDWNEGRVNLHEFPERIDLVNRSLKSSRGVKKVELLLRFGHSTARELIERINYNQIGQAYSLKGKDRQLSTINGDEAAIEIFTEAGELLPCTYEIQGSSDQFEVRYIQNNNFKGK